MLTDPALSGLVSVRELSGHSGARVFLASRDGRRWFVRKIAKEAASSPRLRRQLLKQRRAAATPLGIRTPAILEEGDSGGRFYFDMEFVPGPDGASFIRQASYPDIERFGEALCAYLRRAMSCTDEPGDETFFAASYRKICAVQKQVRCISAETVAAMLLRLDELRAVHLTPTFCHGDLTLDNIIVPAPGEICALDFLDTPWDHVSQDVAKLHQDLSGGWFLLRGPAVSRGVLEYLGRRTLEAATSVFPAYEALHEFLVALAFLRVLPYTRTQEERDFVLTRLDHFARLLTGDARTMTGGSR